MNINNQREQYKNCIFLAGPSGQNSGRKQLISLLSESVPFFDPTITTDSEWSPRDHENKTVCLDTCLRLIYILPENYSPADIFDIGSLSEQFCENFLFLYLGSQVKYDVAQIVSKIIEKGGKIAESLNDAAQIINRVYTPHTFTL